jgi:hypothetical protein
MVRWQARAVAVATLVLGTNAAAQPSNDMRRFDGTWDVSLVCPASADGQGYHFVFPATVTDGHLHGQHGTPHQADSLTYEGMIQPDGSATISANGLTGDVRYNVGGGPQGMPYGYHVTAQFEATHGHGKRTDLRPCDVDFVRH